MDEGPGCWGCLFIGAFVVIGNIILWGAAIIFVVCLLRALGVAI